MSHTITRQAALIELNGEVMALKLSPQAWQQVLEIAAKESGGTLSVAPVPNQTVLDSLLIPTPRH